MAVEIRAVKNRIVIGMLGLTICNAIVGAYYWCTCTSGGEIQEHRQTATWQVVKETRRFNGHGHAIDSVAVSPDGKRALTAGEDGIRLWNLATGDELKHFNARTRSVLFANNGSYFFSGGCDGLIQMWDLESECCMREFVGASKHPILSLALTQDGKFLVSGSGYDPEAFVRVWNVDSGMQVGGLKGDRPGAFAYTLSLFRNDTSLLVVDCQKTIFEWDIKKDRVTRRLDKLAPRPLGNDHYLERASVSTRNGEWAVLAGDRHLQLWNLDSGCLVRSWPSHRFQIRSLACSPTKFWAFGAGGGQKQTGREYSADEPIPYGLARLWNLENGEELCSMEGHTDEITCVAFSPDGRFVVTGSRDKSMRLWQLP